MHALRQLRSQQHGHDLRAVLRHHQTAHRRSDLVSFVRGRIEHGKGYPRRRRHPGKAAGEECHHMREDAHLSACSQRFCQHQARAGKQRGAEAQYHERLAPPRPVRDDAQRDGQDHLRKAVSAHDQPRHHLRGQQPVGDIGGEKGGVGVHRKPEEKDGASTGSSFLNDAFKLAPPFIFFHYTLAAELCKEKNELRVCRRTFPAPWANCSREVRACARSSSPLLAAALLALTPLKVAFCARAEEKAGAALGVFPCAGGLALRIARARAQHRRPARESGKKEKAAARFPALGHCPPPACACARGAAARSGRSGA